MHVGQVVPTDLFLLRHQHAELYHGIIKIGLEMEIESVTSLKARCDRMLKRKAMRPAAKKSLKTDISTVDENASVSKRIFEMMKAIEDEITAGVLLPGQRLDERKLALRFGVSRTPIREVLLKMSSLGIVELRRNQGAFVAELSSGRLVGMLEVLAELKVLAAKQSARRMTIDEREHLAALCKQMTKCAEAKELQGYFQKATELHDAICEGAHNHFLVETTQNAQICLCAYRKYLSQIVHMPIQTSLEENKRIVEAIISGDSITAEKWMRQQTELRKEEFVDLVTLISENNSAVDKSE